MTGMTGLLVLDASALLAFLKGEAGAARVAEALKGAAVMNAVNWAEVLSKLADWGKQPDESLAMLPFGTLQILAFNERDAGEAARLRPPTRDAKLSLGDRCCLATARGLGVPVLTADRGWAKLKLDVAIEQIR
jgi:ribonuclease VapC